MSLRVPVALLAALLTAAAAAGCGSSKPSSTAGPASPSARAEAFPAATGLTFDDIRTRYRPQLSLGIGAGEMRQGANRLPFLILDKGARPIHRAAVALYTMRGDGTHLRGPFAAHEEAFGIKPAYLSRTTASDPDQQKSFYVGTVPFAGKAPQGLFALVRQDGRLVATSPTPLGSPRHGPGPPDVGQTAPRMHTGTVGGGTPVSDLTTRVPPDTDLLADDFADVLGKKPVVLIFATPALCQSRVCGPDVDVAEQVKAEVGDKVAFVHQEIYKDNQVERGLRPQLATYRLETEPWLFVIDRNGRISSRIEGAVSVPELRAAVAKVAG
jgi:hypothetical protein